MAASFSLESLIALIFIDFILIQLSKALPGFVRNKSLCSSNSPWCLAPNQESHSELSPAGRRVMQEANS